jgi:predicted GTPase
LSDVVIINKIDSAPPEGIAQIRHIVNEIVPKAILIEAASPIRVEDPDLIRGKRVLVVEDGPTLTHGGMKFGAGTLAAQKFGASEVIDPRPFLVGQLADTFASYPGIGKVLPAMGYGEQQLKDLQATIRKCDCDAVIIGTPIDLIRVIDIEKPSVRVGYDLQEIGRPDLVDVLQEVVEYQEGS